MPGLVALVALITVLATPATAQMEAGDKVDAEIVLAVDASRSMDLREFAVQRDGYQQALRHPDLIRAIAAGRLGRVAIAYFEWSGQAQDGTLIPWAIIATPNDAQVFADAIGALPIRRGRGTSISRALAFASVLIEDGRVNGTRRVIDISGDGANNVGPPVVEARDDAIARGITINGLPVMLDGGTRANPDLDRYYEDCVIGGEGAFMMVARSGEELASTIRRKLILELSGRVPVPAATPADFEPIDCLLGEKLYRMRNWDSR